MFEKLTAEAKITRAKSQLVFRYPFFSIIALSMDFIEAPWCKTMATDGVNFYFAREFVDKITADELIGVIAHEVLHVAWLHVTRLGSRDHHLFNIACDVVINQCVLDCGLKLPAGGVFGSQYDKYKDWNAEEVYNDLLKNATKVTVSFDGRDGKGDGQTWGGIVKAEHGDGTPLSPDEISELEEEIKIKVTAAAEHAKAIGKLPGALTGLIKAVGAPKIDWKNYIQSWVKGHKPDDYSWSRPNRKMFVNHGIYMPKMTFYGAGHGVLSIDTSGSVSDEELKKYIREIAGVIELCSPDKLTIIQHDAVIQNVKVWEAGDDFNDLKIHGRGGTCIQPSFKYAANMDEPIDWMICFTDMEIGDWPKNAPDFPVLWCATGPDNAPFGTYLPIKDAMGK